MHERAHRPSTELPDRPCALRALRRARRAHQATLAAWAGDLLRLRADGRAEFAWRGGRAEDGWRRRAA